MKKAVLLVGHGSRRKEANEALVKLCDLVSGKDRKTTIAHGFLQFADPGLPDALAELDGQGVDEVTVVPVFLYEGVHIKEDIPEILAREAAKRPNMCLVLAPVLGIDERMADIVWDRVQAARQG